MEGYVFHTELSPEEMEKNFEGFDFFGSLMESLEEARDFAQGKSDAKVTVSSRHLPDVNVAEVRAAVNMTQKAFAATLGVSSRTVESWECGRSNPTPTARKLIYLIQEDHSIIQRLQNM